jgi:SanA protein
MPNLRSMRNKKVLLYTLLLAIISIVITTYLCNRIIVDTARSKLYSDLETIPFNKVGLLLGTSKYGRHGNSNPYYDNRIKAAIKLLNSGKIKYVIISGDNSRADYNEPESMRSDLIKGGIDSAAIFLDYAGFRTFDSIIRLKEIFSQDSVTIISQQFHNQRAIYIAFRSGITAIGFNAAEAGNTKGVETPLREKLARVETFLDFCVNKKPKFLGSKIIIPG